MTRWLCHILCSMLWVPMWAQEVVHLDNVQVVAQRRLKDVGVEMTKLDTVVLHENI